jgi:hypothetical protein
VALLAFASKLVLAVTTYGTNDVYSWERYWMWTHYIGVLYYSLEPLFNHPPSMIYMLGTFGWLSEATRVPFQFWVRLFSSAADVGSLLMLWKILNLHQMSGRSKERALLLFAAAPPLLLLSGFHGNDQSMLFFVLLLVYLTEKGGRDWLAGIAFGLSMSIKVVPLVLVPAIFLYQGEARRRIQFFAAAAAIIAIEWAPFIYQDPRAIFKNVFLYQSFYGQWGLSTVLMWLSRELPSSGWLNEAFFHHWSKLTILSVVALSVWMNRPQRKITLFSQVGIIFMLLLSFDGGFGVQYLAWLTPWVVELGVLPTAIFYFTSSAFLFLVYNYWSGGMPWYLADSIGLGSYAGHVDYFEMLCWSSVVFLLWIAWRRMNTGGTDETPQNNWFPFAAPSPAGKIRAALAALALVVFGLVQDRDSITVINPGGGSSIQAIRGTNAIALQMQLYQMGRYADVIEVGTKALKRDPPVAEIHNNMAAGYAKMRMWDDAIHSAGAAVRLKPNFQVAKSNLVWARNEKLQQVRH